MREKLEEIFIFSLLCAILAIVISMAMAHGFEYKNPTDIESLLKNSVMYDGKKISITFQANHVEFWKGRSDSNNLKILQKTEWGTLQFLALLPLDDNFFPLDSIKENENLIAYGIFRAYGMFGGLPHENFIILDHMESLDRPVVKKRNGT